MKRVLLVIVLTTSLAGCRTMPKISEQKDGGWTRYKQVEGNGSTSEYSITVNDDTGEIKFEHEPPTLSQLTRYTDEIFKQRLVPKLKSGDALSDADLSVLTCCLNVRISKMTAMNRILLESMQLPTETALVYDLVSHTRSAASHDGNRERSDRIDSSENSFNEMLNTLVEEELKMDSVFKDSVSKWGATFSGDDSFSLNLDDRRKLLAAILSERDYESKYLQKGFWKSFWEGCWFNVPAILFEIRDKKPLPNYNEKYLKRMGHVKWRDEFMEGMHKAKEMYVHVDDAVVKGMKEEIQNQQQDRLNDIKQSFGDCANSIRDKSALLVYDYPFAISLLECMRMMDYYFQNEWFGITVDEVKEKRYRPVALSLVDCAKSLCMQRISHPGLKRLYEKVYVRFLMNTYDKTAEELYSEGLIPFPTDDKSRINSLDKDRRIGENASQSISSLIEKEAAK